MQKTKIVIKNIMSDFFYIYCLPCCPMRPKEPRVGDKYGRPVWEISMRNKWEISKNLCGLRNLEWEINVGNKYGK